MKWIQISDIHFNFDNFDTKALRENLIITLKDIPDVDFLIITGDVLYKYGKSEQDIQSAVDFIAEIRNACGVKKRNVYLTPGNHDVNQKDTDRNKLISKIRKRKKMEIKGNEDKELSFLGHDRFKGLYKRVTGKDYKAFSVNVYNDRVCIVNINSCLLSKDRKDDQALTVCCDELTKLNNRFGNGDRLNLAIMHHGVDFFHETARNQFQHWADKHYIDLVLCGHSHRAGLRTYDETLHEIKQVTCGAALMDEYALPSFYLYDFNEKEWKMRIELYTYSEGGSWVRDGQHLRAFVGGVYEYCVPRKYDRVLKNSGTGDCLYVENLIANQMQFLNQLDDKFVKMYGSKIESSKGSQGEEFSTKKMLKSLMAIEIPVDKALLVISDAVDLITRADFSGSGENGHVNTGDIRTCIYNAICNLPVSDGDGISNIQVNDWAGKYARRYGHNNRKVSIVFPDGKSRILSYTLVKELARDVAEKVTGDKTYYTCLPHTELDFMHNDIMEFIKSCEMYYIKYDVLCAFIEEMAIETPHPWMINDETRMDIMDYNKEVLARHMKKAQSNKEQRITVLEMVYHSTAMILGLYSNILGCREISCLKLLRRSVNYFNEDNTAVPMKRQSVIEMFRDLRECGIEKTVFMELLNGIYSECITDKNLESSTLKKSVLVLSRLAMDLYAYRLNGYQIGVSLLTRVQAAFQSSGEYIVQRTLRDFNNCFWINPRRTDEAGFLQSGMSPILVVIWSRETWLSDRLTEYLSKKDTFRGPIIFIRDDGQTFSEEEKACISGEIFGGYICAFLDDGILKETVADGKLDHMLKELIHRKEFEV